jgi:hypothetical protein
MYYCLCLIYRKQQPVNIIGHGFRKPARLRSNHRQRVRQSHLRDGALTGDHIFHYLIVLLLDEFPIDCPLWHHLQIGILIKPIARNAIEFLLVNCFQTRQQLKARESGGATEALAVR